MPSLTRMDIRQLQVVIGLADHGSFSAAADALHTVQSNVSAHVARLERELRTTVIDRPTGRMTEEGEVVVAHARRVLAELEGIVSDLAALRHEVVGTARIGIIGTTARWLVPKLLELASTRHPELRLEVMEATSASLEVPLASGRVDLAVGTLGSLAPDLQFTPLFEEDLVLIVPARSEFASDVPVTLAQLAGIGMLLPLPGTAFRAEIDTAADRAGVRLRATAEIDGTRLLASLTFDGHGPSILPATAVPEYMRNDWRLVPVAELSRRTVGVVRRGRGVQSAPARAVVELLTELTGPGAELPDGLHTLAPSPPAKSTRDALRRR